jgi:hypothetical protein
MVDPKVTEFSKHLGASHKGPFTSPPFTSGVLLPNFVALSLMVMIVACQVMDPGSIPGERIFLVFLIEF